ncbi:hypothetical protein AG1IA_03650 [Rhizoctonia solani AG-1 IA]|uniref:Secreted protein n=1 Tax=Thanatephorus cucumeris (strain AG1-IA) TaxID=983506 RepID=L8X147_THACA|nr:hypothetical protein AG1IA_03650 [Rhizoctonia solani AG-1 IA]
MTMSIALMHFCAVSFGTAFERATACLMGSWKRPPCLSTDIAIGLKFSSSSPPWLAMTVPFFSIFLIPASSRPILKGTPRGSVGYLSASPAH